MWYACRKLASSYPKLVHFEICVLANLAPGDAEEAKLMIPSIVVCLMLAVIHVNMEAVVSNCVATQGKVSEEELVQIVDEVATYR